jgi:1-acyl-sn-glycerol-3-phosphate acyltransferase
MKLFVYEAKGFERIPTQGPVILVANHASYIDGPLIIFFTEWHRNRWVHGLQSREWLGTSWLKRFLFLGIFRQIITNGSVERALEALTQHACAVLLFPEGGRSADGTMKRATHTGLGVLASQTGAQVIPIGIQGTYAWWPRNKTMPSFRPKCIALSVGKPLRYRGKATKKKHLAFQRSVLKAVAKLARTTYQY